MGQKTRRPQEFHQAGGGGGGAQAGRGGLVLDERTMEPAARD